MHNKNSEYLSRMQDVPHYYGDYVRVLFVVVAILSAIAIPTLGDLLPFGTFVQVISVILLVLLAGLTNPHSKMMFAYNAIVSGVGALLIEMTAIYSYSYDPLSLFIAREGAVVALLFAFYLSVKTLRAMALGKVGKMEQPWEFETEDKEKLK